MSRVELLRILANSEGNTLDPSDQGYLREIANDLEAGVRHGWLDRMWTLWLLGRWLFVSRS